MQEFMSLREFLLLKNPLCPTRSALSEIGRMRHNEIKLTSYGEDLVERYDIAKASWMKYGVEGPPVGVQVEMLEHGHGSAFIGAIRTFEGICPYDKLFFQVRSEAITSTSFVLRETWFVSMKVL